MAKKSGKKASHMGGTAEHMGNHPQMDSAMRSAMGDVIDGNAKKKKSSRPMRKNK
jgi:hypothetical protein